MLVCTFQVRMAIWSMGMMAIFCRIKCTIGINCMTGFRLYMIVLHATYLFLFLKCTEAVITTSLHMAVQTLM